MTEIFQDEAGEWRFRIRGRNGEIVASSEGYTTERDAERGLITLRAILAATEDDKPRRLS